MSSTMRTPCPSRSAPQIWMASQMEGRPNASPAWMVMWWLAAAMVRNASSGRVAGLAARDVEADHAGVPVAQRELGDLRGVRRRAHGGEQQPDLDPALRRHLLEPGEDRLHDLVQLHAALEVQLGCEADLGVDHAVVGQVLGALGCDAGEGLGRLHDPDRVLEGLQVARQAAPRSALHEPGGQLVGVRGGQARVALLGGQLDHRRRPQTSVEVVVQEDLGGLPDQLERGAVRHALTLPVASRDV
jgi:hypothetical protein